MKKIIALVLALFSLCAEAQITINIGGGNRDRVVDGRRGMDRDRRGTTYLDAGSTAKIYVPGYILDMHPTSIRFDGNSYVRVQYSNNREATILGLRSTNGTQVVMTYKWTEKTETGSKFHEETYSFPVVVNRVDPESITIRQMYTVGWGKVVNLSPSLYPDYAECGFSYDSENPKVAQVSYGLIRGESLGETTITVRTSNGLSASALVRVVVPPCESVKFDNTNKKFGKVGDEQHLSARFTPEHAEPVLSWESSDPNIAYVDENNVLHAVGEGKVTITLHSDNGEKYHRKYKIKAK